MTFIYLLKAKGGKKKLSKTEGTDTWMQPGLYWPHPYYIYITLLLNKELLG